MRFFQTFLIARPVMLPFMVSLLLIAGCDKPSGPQEQAESADRNRDGAIEARGKITLKSANGMMATLSYEYAGQPAPDDFFNGADGRDVSLRDFAGRPLLVNIWATWCVPCRVEMPTIDALAKLEEGRISVIAVNQDLQGARPAMDFFRRIGIRNLEPYSDPDNALSAAYDAIPLPTTILYDSEGKEVWRVQGGFEWNDKEVSKLLREAA